MPDIYTIFPSVSDHSIPSSLVQIVTRTTRSPDSLMGQTLYFDEGLHVILRSMKGGRFRRYNRDKVLRKVRREKRRSVVDAVQIQTS